MILFALAIEGHRTQSNSLLDSCVSLWIICRPFVFQRCFHFRFYRCSDHGGKCPRIGYVIGPSFRSSFFCYFSFFFGMISSVQGGGSPITFQKEKKTEKEKAKRKQKKRRRFRKKKQTRDAKKTKTTRSDDTPTAPVFPTKNQRWSSISVALVFHNIEKKT